MILVVDASVAVKWFLASHPAEDDADRALRILEGAVNGRHTLVAPPHFFSEVAAVLAREKPREALRDLADLLDLEFSRVDDREVYAKAVELAMRHDHHVFDTLYHAAALLTPGATLVTADRRYFSKVKVEGRIAMLHEIAL